MNLSSGFARGHRFGIALLVCSGQLSGLRLEAEIGLAELSADLLTDRSSQGGSDPVPLIATEAGLFFRAFESSLGSELWFTGGTPETTRLVADLCPGPCFSEPDFLGKSDESVYFAVVDGYFHYEVALVAVNHDGTNPRRLVGSDEYAIAGLHAVDYPAAFVALEEFAIFPVRDSLDLRLLRTEGSAESTTFFATIGVEADPRYPGQFEAVGPSLSLFVLSGGGAEVAPELWRSDGTAEGTFALAQFDLYSQPGFAGSTAGLAYVVVPSYSGSSELWVSDGSITGTQRLTQFSDPTSRIEGVVIGDRRTYFSVNGATSGQELWSTDGSAAGTTPATSFGYHAPLGSIDVFTSLSDLVAVHGERAYFLASDGIHDRQLWRTDGDPSSVAVLAETCTSSQCAAPWIEIWEGEAVFAAASESGVEPMVTVGGSGPATLLADLCPGPCSSEPQGTRTVYRGFSVFTARASDQTQRPMSLWLSRGLDAHPVKVDDSAFLQDLLHYSQSVAATGDLIFFVGASEPHDVELWQTPGAENSAVLVRDIQSSNEGSLPRALETDQGRVAFVARDAHRDRLTRIPVPGGTPVRIEGDYSFCGSNGPFKQSLLPEGLLLADCFEELFFASDSMSVATGIHDFYPARVVAIERFENEGMIVVSGVSADEIWRTEGTSADIAFVVPDGGRLIAAPSVVNHRPLLLVETGDRATYQIPRADWTGLDEIFDAEDPEDLRVAAGATSLAFFLAETDGSRQLWRTDGTIAGSQSVAPVTASTELLAAAPLANGYLLALRHDFDTSVTLARTTGQPGPIEYFLEIDIDRRDGPILTASFDGMAFVRFNSFDGQHLWRTDGTVEGTTRIGDGDFVPGQPETVLLATPNGLFFDWFAPGLGTEPWIVESSQSNPRLFHDIFPGEQSSAPAEMTLTNDFIYFSADDGIHGRELWQISLDAPARCLESVRAVCLGEGRFRAESVWRNFEGDSGRSNAVPVTTDTGYFWFFEAENVELILKLIDGGGFNGHHWVFYGALSNVEYSFTVTDTETGAAKRYFNPAGRFASAGDILAFGPLGAHTSGSPAIQETLAGSPPRVESSEPLADFGASGTCTPTATRFCILENRFGVEATWRNFAGNSGVANASSLTDDTGYLWFFDDDNVEVVLKAVDGGGSNGHFWIYYGALSNVEYTITVTDTVAGTSRTYRNPLGSFGSFGDIEAFPAD